MLNSSHFIYALVFSSSATVYVWPKEDPWTEDFHDEPLGMNKAPHRGYLTTDMTCTVGTLIGRSPLANGWEASECSPP